MPESLSQRLRAIREAAQQPKTRPVPVAAPAEASASSPASGATLNPPWLPSAGLSTNSGPASTSGINIHDDKVERLICRARDEVQLDRQSGLDSEEEEVGEPPKPEEIEGPDSLEREASLPSAPSQRDTSNLLRESKGVLDQAALLQSSTAPPSASSSSAAAASTPSALTSGQRSKPILTRGSTSRLQGHGDGGQVVQGSGAEDDSAELADDLAEALGEKVSSRPALAIETEQRQVASSISPRGADQTQVDAAPSSSRQERPEPQSEQDEIQDEVDALIARFSALRPARQASPTERASTSPPTRSSSSSPPPAYTSDDSEGGDNPGIRDPFAALSLPSVPSSEPTLPSEPFSSSSAPAVHPTLGPAHNDLPADLDLAPFRRLVGRELDVRRLDEPSERSLDPFPSVPSSSSTSQLNGEGKDDEEETFCSICSAPPTLSCFSPRDPEDEGCMGDVYCSECWVQAHEGMQREELREHRTRDLPRKGGGGAKKKGAGGGGRKPLAA